MAAEETAAVPPACEKNTKPSFSTKESKKHKLRETQNGGTAAICEVTADRPQQHNNKSRRFFWQLSFQGLLGDTCWRWCPKCIATIAALIFNSRGARALRKASCAAAQN